LFLKANNKDRGDIVVGEGKPGALQLFQKDSGLTDFIFGCESRWLLLELSKVFCCRFLRVLFVLYKLV
jgi:hypothetical protein